MVRNKTSMPDETILASSSLRLSHLAAKNFTKITANYIIKDRNPLEEITSIK